MVHVYLIIKRINTKEKSRKLKIKKDILRTYKYVAKYINKKFKSITMGYGCIDYDPHFGDTDLFISIKLPIECCDFNRSVNMPIELIKPVKHLAKLNLTEYKQVLKLLGVDYIEPSINAITTSEYMYPC